MASIGSKVVPIPGPCRVTLHAIADLQFGSKACDTILMKHKLDEIVRDPSGGMSVILGDMTDDDRPTTRDLRKSAFASRPEVQDADARDKKFFIDQKVIPMLLPLAKTKLGIAGVLAGHHWSNVRVEAPKTETNPKGVQYVNSARYICDELGRLTLRKVPYLGVMSAWIEITFKTPNGNSVMKTIHVQHGTGGGQTLASALNKLEMTARWAQADALIRAHDCKLVSAKLVRLGPRKARGGERRSLAAKNIALLNIGSMTRGYVLDEDEPDYVEMAMMRPVAMGWGEMHFDIHRATRAEDKNSSYTADIKVTI